MSFAPFCAAAVGLREIENVACVASVGSTNGLMRSLLQGYLDDEVKLATTCLLALEQTAGRGRGERRWSSPAGQGLYLTLVRAMRPGEPTGLLPLLVGVAVANVLRENFGIAAELKWPNDVLAGSRKIAGILVEAVSCGESLYALIGIGVNVAQRQADFAAELAGLATSVAEESGAPAALVPVFTALIRRLDADLGRLAEPGWIVAEWRRLTCHRAGEPLRVSATAGRVEGQYIDIAESGHLLLRDATGKIHELVNQELS